MLSVRSRSFELAPPCGIVHSPPVTVLQDCKFEVLVPRSLTEDTADKLPFSYANWDVIPSQTIWIRGITAGGACLEKSCL